MSTIPQPTDAAQIVQALVGVKPADVHRFATGVSHYVYEVTFAGRKPLVVRMTTDEQRMQMVGAARLSRLLRPLGVPLPAILADGTSAALPYLVLERLAGTDLGAIVDDLSDNQLRNIAMRVAAAQAATARTPTAGRYGYAAVPEGARHRTWSAKIAAGLVRSRERIAAAGLFDVATVDAVDWIVVAARSELDRMPATPFLHDTTTKNVIVTSEGEFSGIVDVDDLCFGDPRFAAALTQAAITAFRRPSGYVAHWLAAAGLTADRVFRLYVTLCLVDFMSEHGQVFNGNMQPSDPEERARLLEVVEEHIATLNNEWEFA